MPQPRFYTQMGTFLLRPWAAGIPAAPLTPLKQLWLLHGGLGSARVQLARFVLQRLLRIT